MHKKHWKVLVVLSYQGLTCVQRSTYLFEALSWKVIPLQPYFICNYSFSDPTEIYLFEFSNNNSRIKCELCSKLTIEAPYVVLVSLLLTLKIFDTFLVFFCWVWTCKSWMEYLIAIISVGSRRPVTFKMKLSVLTFNNSFQLLHVFCYKELHLRCCTGLELNIVTWFTTILKGIRGYSPWSSAALGKYENLIFLDTLKIHF